MNKYEKAFERIICGDDYDVDYRVKTFEELKQQCEQCSKDIILVQEACKGMNKLAHKYKLEGEYLEEISKLREVINILVNCFDLIMDLGPDGLYFHINEERRIDYEALKILKRYIPVDDGTDPMDAIPHILGGINYE